jgi:hypothetical protein
MPLVREIYGREWDLLSELNRATSELFREILGIDTKTVLASELEARDDPTLRLVDLCRAVGADTYLSGSNGRNYMDMSLFEEEGIRVIFQDFTPPVYTQVYDGFIPGLSTIDHIFNVGDSLLELMRKGRNIE